MEHLSMIVRKRGIRLHFRTECANIEVMVFFCQPQRLGLMGMLFYLMVFQIDVYQRLVTPAQPINAVSLNVLDSSLIMLWKWNHRKW